ncbi:MAG: NUDIX hydrolase [Candidatus Omnitrophica bacterium]|nr:NUDIX hydrolase [Candidatus Omnitrophota bacterium]
MNPTIDDPRLYSPQCSSLTPIEKVHENPWFCVFNRGGHFTIENMQLQVLILPIVENSSVIMVRVRRPVIADNVLEIPAGGVNKNESPVEAAQRELCEETGIYISGLNRFHLQVPLVLTPRGPCFAHIFQIHLTQEEFDGRSKHDDEILSVECFTFKEALKKIEKNEIYGGFPIAILTRFLLQNHQLMFAADIKKERKNKCVKI